MCMWPKLALVLSRAAMRAQQKGIHLRSVGKVQQSETST
jgi:hypothetical protein